MTLSSDTLRKVLTDSAGRSQEATKQIFEDNSVDLHTLVGALYTSDSQTLELLCKCIDRVAPIYGLKVFLDEYQPLLLSGLENSNTMINELVLHILLLNDSPENDIKEALLVPLLAPLILLLGSDSIGIAELTAQAIIKISKTSAPSLFSEQSMPIWQGLLVAELNVRFRVYSVLLRVASSGASGYDAVAKSGLLKELVADLHADDIMCRVNAIESLGLAPEGPYGIETLKYLDIFNILLTDLTTPENGLDAQLVNPTILKFFAVFALKRIDEFCTMTQLPGFLASISSIVDEGSDAIMTSVALTCVGNIASTSKGYELLRRDTKNQLLLQLARACRRFGGDTRNTVAQAFSCAMKGVDVSNSESMQSTQDLFAAFGGWVALKQLLTSAFFESRVSGYAVLEALAHFRWFVVDLHNQGDLLNVLLDRSKESTSGGKEWKVIILKTILSHNDIESIFAPEITKRIKDYIVLGAFAQEYVPQVSYVSV